MTRLDRWAVLGPVLLASACGGAPPRPTETARAEMREAIDTVLDDWHAAAAASDEARYFALMAPDAVFLGTDASERWTRDALREYARPHFEAGNGWAFRAARRDVVVGPRGRLAWFDETLETENLGPARGSGVLRREPEGWRIVQYNLALTVPNERFAQVRALLAGEPPPRIEGTDILDTPANRAAIAAVERYREAIVARDADAVLAMISNDYHEDGGTPQPGDDMDAEILRRELADRLARLDTIELAIEYRSIHREGGLVHVDVTQEASWTFSDSTVSTHDEHRYTLERDATGWRFVSGL
ncbi:MAG TPA: nuclear transport factor 2 family protein [Sandaracinaceae bacterium LLY-WYZ-13_1]|nr:nuclear transport factor 2 family protein [Sandaracinaceae bacterium LLY-WYZ-13_1]